MAYVASTAAAARPATAARRAVPLPTSYTFDRLAESTNTRRLTAFIKADIRNRLNWRKQS